MRIAAAGAAAAAAALLLGLLGLVFIAAIAGGGGRTTPGLPGVVCAPPGVDPAQLVEGFAAEQVSNAGLIVATGTDMGVPERAKVVAVATAMQESTLNNIDHGDRDSLGLFQQRPSQGWGTPEQITDPAYSSRIFYERLLEVPGWESMPITVAAQTVQRSAFPDAYAKWEQPAATLVGSFEGVSCGAGTAPGAPPGGPGGGPLPPADPQIQRVISRAMSQQGQPYVWGGGDASGPTRGGFDCSGLMVYAFSELGIKVPHQTQAIWDAFQPPITDRNALQPGDMVLFSSNGSPGGIHHIGLYLGNGQMLHAPQTGDVVKIEPNIWANTYYSGEFIGGVRATNPAAAQAA